MVDTPRKTFPELQALSAPVVDSDVLAVYRTPGPAKRTTASVFADYIKAFYSASGGSALVGFLQAGTGAVPRTMQAKVRDGAVTPADYGAVGDGATNDAAALALAIAAADAGGFVLDWGAKTYAIATALDVTLTGAMRWRASGATVLYTGGSDANIGFNVALPVGKDHALTGSGFLFDGASKCNQGIRFHQNLGNQTATFYAEGLGSQNIDMFSAAASSSAAITVFGGFKSVRLVRPTASNVRMRTGAGVPGSRGVTGVKVLQNVGVSGSYTKTTEIEDPVIDRVYNQDATYTTDMDGIGVFANPDVDSTFGPSNCRITGSIISRCWGRDVKTQTSYTFLEPTRSSRSEGPTGGIISAAYDIQSGSGLVIGGEYTVDGVVISGGLVRFSCGTATSPMSSEWIGGTISLVNGATATFIGAHDPTTGVERAVSKFSGQTVRGNIPSFVKIRTNGYDTDICRVENLSASRITSALFLSSTRSGGSSPYRAILQAAGCVQLNAALAPMAITDGGSGSQFIVSQSGCYGFTEAPTTYNSAVSSGLGGIEQVGTRYPVPYQTGTPGSVYLSGTERDFALTLAAGETYTLPSHGLNGVFFATITMDVSAFTAALVCVGSTITSIFAGASTQVSGGGDPGTGDLRVWRTGANLVVKNGTGAQAILMVKLFG